MKKRRVMALLGALIVVFAAACVGGPTEANWGHLSLVGEPQNILLAFSDRMVLIDPVDGSPVELRDANGDIRVDPQGNPRVWDVRGSGNTPTQFYTSPVVLDDDRLLATSYMGRLYEIELEAARIVNTEGRPTAGHVVANLLATPEFLYVPLSEGGVEALSRPNLTQAWIFEAPEHGVWAQPILVDDTLYITSLDHHLYALDPESGEELWRVDLQGAVASSPVYNDGYLYLGSFARKLFKISPDGEIVAEYATRDWVWGSPALVDGVLYAADLGGFVYALEDNGDEFDPVWEPRQVAARAIRAAPIVTGDVIIVGSRDQYTYWIDGETGAEITRREMGGEVLADMLLLEPSDNLDISEPLVIVSTMAREQLLFAFTASGGVRQWRFPPL
jgi:outer membrane protein assembly factor BamB